MSILDRGVRNAFRNATRTVAIVVILAVTIGLSFVMLVSHRSIQGKIDATLASIGDAVTMVPVGSSTATASARYLTTAELAKVVHLRHVVSLDEVLGSDPRAVGPETFVGTNDPTDPANIGASTLTVVAGHPINGKGDSDEAMVSTTMAKRDHLEVGSTFAAYDRTFTVTAIFDSDTDSGNTTVVVPLATEQHLTHRDGDVARATATVDSLTHLGTVAGDISLTLGPGADVTSDIGRANQALGPLESVKSLSLYSLFGAAGAAAIISLLVMVMIVRQRRREVGILKAIGGPNRTIMLQFLTEALTFSVLGGAAGLLAGALTAGSVTSSLVGTSHAHATTSAADIVVGLAGILLVAAFGSAGASYVITRIQPADALRSE